MGSRVSRGRVVTTGVDLAGRSHQRTSVLLRRWLAETHTPVAGAAALTIGSLRLVAEVVYDSPTGAHGFGPIHVLDAPARRSSPRCLPPRAPPTRAPAHRPTRRSTPPTRARCWTGWWMPCRAVRSIRLRCLRIWSRLPGRSPTGRRHGAGCPRTSRAGCCPRFGAGSPTTPPVPSGAADARRARRHRVAGAAWCRARDGPDRRPHRSAAGHRRGVSGRGMAGAALVDQHDADRSRRVQRFRAAAGSPPSPASTMELRWARSARPGSGELRKWGCRTRIPR